MTTRKTAVKKTSTSSSKKVTPNMSESKSKKVDPSAEKPKKEKVERVDFTGGDRNEDGLLTAIPGDWDPKVHKNLGKGDFAAPDVFLEFSADRIEERANALLAKAAKNRERAEHLRKFGDPVKVRKAQKLAKLREQMQALAGELEDEGFDLESFLSDD